MHYREKIEFKIITFNTQTGNIRWENLDNRVWIVDAHKATLEIIENVQQIKQYVIAKNHPIVSDINVTNKPFINNAFFDPFKIAAESDDSRLEKSLLDSQKSSIIKFNESSHTLRLKIQKNKVKDLKQFYKEVYYLKSQKACMQRVNEKENNFDKGFSNIPKIMNTNHHNNSEEKIIFVCFSLP